MSTARPTLSADTRQRLADALRPDVRALESFAARRFPDWHL